jgi:hypothetical protein
MRGRLHELVKLLGELDSYFVPLGIVVPNDEGDIIASINIDRGENRVEVWPAEMSDRTGSWKKAGSLLTFFAIMPAWHQSSVVASH